MRAAYVERTANGDFSGIEIRRNILSVPRRIHPRVFNADFRAVHAERCARLETHIPHLGVNRFDKRKIGPDILIPFRGDVRGKEFLFGNGDFVERRRDLGIVHGKPQRNALQFVFAVDPDLRRADPADIDGQVTFDHVRFGYTPDKTVIHDFSCTVQPGQKVAIVGPTGAGKTTMVKLLMRFYDVDAGSITLNGHNVRDFDRSALREGFGMVLQDTWLFKGTIMENIRYGRLDATDEEVIAAAKAANADHFIRTLPGGYQMELNEDASNVSQGQKQLLTIARAILADNRILILDEATSSVDTRTEQRIQTAMDNLMRGRTSFVIAHRLSTIRDADLILVMRDGDIVEQGTHDQLIEKGGFYADLYNSQFEDVVE